LLPEFVHDVSFAESFKLDCVLQTHRKGRRTFVYSRILKYL
jgi:hypothetical protein